MCWRWNYKGYSITSETLKEWQMLKTGSIGLIMNIQLHLHSARSEAAYSEVRHPRKYPWMTNEDQQIFNSHVNCVYEEAVKTINTVARIMHYEVSSTKQRLLASTSSSVWSLSTPLWRKKKIVTSRGKPEVFRSWWEKSRWPNVSISGTRRDMLIEPISSYQIC